MPRESKTFLRRLFEFKWLFAVNLVILILLSLSFGREFIRNSEIEDQIADLEAQASKLESRNLELLELNTAFQTQSFIEREARLKLGMKRPGEDVVVVKRSRSDNPDGRGENSDGTDDPLQLLEGEAPEQVANPTRWWYYFFDKSRFSKL